MVQRCNGFLAVLLNRCTVIKNMKIKKYTQLTGHNGAIFSICRTDQPRYFLSSAGDGWIVKWDLEAPEKGQLIAKTEVQIFSLLFLESINKVIAGNMNGGVYWINLDQPEETKNIAHHEKGVFGIIRNKNFVFTIGGGGVLTKWSIEEAKSMESIQLSNDSLRSIALDPINNILAIGSSDRNIYLLDAETLDLKRKIENAHQNSVFSLCFDPKGQFLLSGGRDAHLNVWNVKNDYRLLKSIPAHLFTINEIVFHPQGLYFATASRDKTIKIWNMQGFELQQVLEPQRDKGHWNSVNTLLWSDHEHCLISGSDDRTMIVWNV